MVITRGSKTKEVDRVLGALLYMIHSPSPFFPLAISTVISKVFWFDPAVSKVHVLYIHVLTCRQRHAIDKVTFVSEPSQLCSLHF